MITLVASYIGIYILNDRQLPGLSMFMFMHSSPGASPLESCNVPIA